MRISKTQYSTAIVATAALLAANFLLFRSPILGVPVAAAFFFLLAVAAARFARRDRTAATGLRDLLEGAVIVVSLWTVIATAAYYLWRFDSIVMWTMVAGSAVGAILASSQSPVASRPTPDRPYSLLATRYWLLIPLGLTLVWATALLVTSATTAVIRSPWQVVSPRFLVLVGLSVLGIFALTLKRETRKIAVIGATTIVTLSLSVAAFSYRIGYGFDPFIHEAGMKVIAEKGEILPKTPYYIGAYVDIVSVSELTSMPLHDLNRFAGPIVGTGALAAIAVTIATVAGTPFVALAVLLMTLSPLSHFIMTTPQGIADALALLAVALAFAAANDRRRFLPAYLLAVAALATHPIAGVPAICVVAILHLSRFSTPDSRLPTSTHRLLATGYWLLACATIAFPTVAFLAQKTIGITFDLGDAPGRLTALATAIIHPPTVATFSPGRTLVYLFRSLFPFLLVTSAAYAALKKDEGRKTRIALLSGAAATAIGGVAFAALLKLDGTIATEQLVFPLRFVSLAGLFLFPLALLAWLDLAKRLSSRTWGRVTLVVCLALAVPTATYLAYPRVDPEDLSKGFNVSAETVAAVELIHDKGQGDYVVLGNQTDAAAEIWRRGFSHYYEGEFFYAHQSGAPGLYANYLKVVETGVSRERLRDVMARYDVDSVFLVIHDYWTGAARAVSEAQATADDAYEIEGGKIWVFEYRR